MTVDEVLDAVREQNAQVAAGRIGGQPALPGTEFEYIVNAHGRLQTEAEFGNIVVKTGAEGDVAYLRDVARLELGPETYALRSMLDAGATVGIPIFQLPGANALELSQAVREKMAELAKVFPEGVTYDIAHDPTVFVRRSIEAVVETLLEAVLLVVLVVVLFLQTWRASVAPLVSVPVAIVGTLAVLLLLGFSINSLTLFGLALATGIVVDDAIVVVENIERKIEAGLAPKGSGPRGNGGGDATDHFNHARSVLRIRAGGFPEWNYRRVLSAVCRHHRGIDCYLDVQLADFVTRAGRLVAASPAGRTGSAATVDRPDLRPALSRIQSWAFAWLSQRYGRSVESAARHRRVILARFCGAPAGVRGSCFGSCPADSSQDRTSSI